MGQTAQTMLTATKQIPAQIPGASTLAKPAPKPGGPLIHSKVANVSDVEVKRLDNRLNDVRKEYETLRNTATAKYGPLLSELCCQNLPPEFAAQQRVDIEEIELDKIVKRDMYDIDQSSRSYQMAMDDPMVVKRFGNQRYPSNSLAGFMQTQKNMFY